MTLEFLHEKRRRRFAFLGALHLQHVTTGRSTVSWLDASKSLLLEQEAAVDFITYLQELGLIEDITSESLKLTRAGISEYENRYEALQRLEAERVARSPIEEEKARILGSMRGSDFVGKHIEGIIQKDKDKRMNEDQDVLNLEKPLQGSRYPVSNTTHIKNIVENAYNSPVMQASNGSIQNVDYKLHDPAALVAVIKSIRGAIDSAPLSPSDKADIEADLKTVEAQATKSKPNVGTILGHMKTAGEVLKLYRENPAIAAAYDHLVQFIQQAPGMPHLLP